LLQGAKLRLATLGLAMVLLGWSAAPVSGQRAALGMLDQLDPGRWELRLREPGGPVERLCLRDGRRLIQLRHAERQCERFVVSDQPGDVTIQYTCPGRGYGRTHIHRESDRVVQIESQGIADGLPFNFVAEGRYVGGDCTP
jgi:hypothetical protein